MQNAVRGPRTDDRRDPSSWSQQTLKPVSALSSSLPGVFRCFSPGRTRMLLSRKWEHVLIPSHYLLLLQSMCVRLNNHRIDKPIGFRAYFTKFLFPLWLRSRTISVDSAEMPRFYRVYGAQFVHGHGAAAAVGCRIPHKHTYTQVFCKLQVDSYSNSDGDWPRRGSSYCSAAAERRRCTSDRRPSPDLMPQTTPTGHSSTAQQLCKLRDRTLRSRLTTPSAFPQPHQVMSLATVAAKVSDWMLFCHPIDTVKSLKA